MDNDKKKPYDLEERTLKYARMVINLCRKLPNDTINSKIIGQLIRAAGSVGANYREASEGLSKKDFIHKMRIARKECKESSYWLELLKTADSNYPEEINELIGESRELRNIFTAIIGKSV
jgi:four helix bundle protein